MKTKEFYITLMFIAVLITLVACGFKADVSTNYDVTATGTIQQTGITTYMYGTHVLKDDSGKTLYALKSDAVNLDDYVDKGKVAVQGDLIPGYPVDGGPNYLNVKKVE
jgi:cell division protein FtsX